MTRPLPHAGRAVWLGLVLAACTAIATSPAFAARAPPASSLTPELLFGLAVLGPVLVPAAAYTAGLIAELLQRNREN